MALPETGNNFDGPDNDRGSPVIGPARRRVGMSTLSISTIAATAWLCWRAGHLGLHPIELAVFATELVSIVSGVIVAVGMARATDPRRVHGNDPRESFRFAFAVADIVGRTRALDLRVGLASAFRVLRRPGAQLADLSMAAVLVDGPRRLALVVTMTLALVIGVAPIPLPPPWAIAFGIAAMALMSCTHVLLSGGRIRFGDRVRWSSAALGEICSGADREGVAPRRWVGTVAVVVVLNLSVALRGMSDRWTHGLAPMDADDRLMTMAIAIMVVIGSLYTLRTTAVPQLANAHLVSRHTEERTARQSAIGGAVLIGLIGLLAGVLPGNVDAADDDPARIEQISDVDPGGIHAERIRDNSGG